MGAVLWMGFGLLAGTVRVGAQRAGGVEATNYVADSCHDYPRLGSWPGPSGSP